MTDSPLVTEHDELGSARKPKDNPLTFMWAVLLGLPGALFFMLLFKLNS